MKDRLQTGREVDAVKRRIKQLEKSYERNKHKDAVYASRVMQGIRDQK